MDVYETPDGECREWWPKPCPCRCVERGARLAHLEALLRAWGRAKRADCRWMTAEEKAVFDEARKLVEEEG